MRCHSRSAPSLTLPALLVLVGAPAAAQTVRYTVTDLGTIPGSTVCVCFQGVALSNQGHIVNFFFGENGRYAGSLWEDGVMTNIGSLGFGVTIVRDVNDSGVAVGNSQPSASVGRAFRYENGVMTDLGTFNGGTHSDAYAINTSGVIAGDAEKRFGNEVYQRAARWVNGTPTDLGTFGGEYSSARGINSAGHIVGWAWDAARHQRAFRWIEGQGMIDLGDLGVPFTIAMDINDAGQIVGTAQPAGFASGTTHAFLWQNGVMADLGVLPEAGRVEGDFGPELVQTNAAAINNAGIIVGNSYPNTLPRGGPWVWRSGVMTNLNDLSVLAPGWNLTAAADINDHGHIAATARPPSGTGSRAVLLTPIPCAADWDASGAVEPVDVAQFVNAWTTSLTAGTLAGDFSGDGHVTPADVASFVGAWFASIGGDCAL